MYANARAKWTGLLYLAPALVFVTIFTVYPLAQMIWVSFNNWSLISPPKWVGTANFLKAFTDRQFWVSLGFTVQYTTFVTPILMIGGYAIALLVAGNSRLQRFTRTVVFIPVVIGLGASSLLWYWLFSPDAGFINTILKDLGIIHERVLWLGVNAEISNWAIIISIVWKVIGFGMILFVGAIQAIPSEVNEAALVDGATGWQRLTAITLPLTLRTVLLVTLISVIGSLLAFDQFYIMTAGQPQNRTATSVFFIYLNSFPYLKLGYGAALSLIMAVFVLLFTLLQMLLTRRSHS